MKAKSLMTIIMAGFLSITWVTQGQTQEFGPVTSHSVSGPSGTPLAGDFNGDGYDDIGIYNTAKYGIGVWFIALNNKIGGFGTMQFGPEYGDVNDLPVTGDFNGDGYTDIAVYRAGDTLYFKYNDGVGGFAGGSSGSRVFSRSGQPVSGDFNGDGYDDIGIYNTANYGTGVWFIALNNKTDGFGTLQFGPEYGDVNDLPVTGDFNGDGYTDIAVYRGEILYFRYNNGAGGFAGGGTYVFEGYAGQQPVSGDFNGDGYDDIGLNTGSTWNIALRNPLPVAEAEVLDSSQVKPLIESPDDVYIVEGNTGGGANVTLDGSASYNVGVLQTALTFGWSGAVIASGMVVEDVYLPLGSHTITLRVTNPAGLSHSDTLIITVRDTTPPVVVITHPEDDSTIPSAAIPVNGSAADIVTDITSVDVSMDARIFPVEEGEFGGILVKPSNEFSITAVAVDGSGNIGEDTVTVTKVHDLGKR